ncbi:TPA: hypothetical protein DDW35_11080, partial [Candidatus Sumerlaeota bacterium]|nr:hypothetical protein [Candidatus Sumerlaeota bacterium]
MSVEQRFPPPDFGQGYVYPKSLEVYGRPDFVAWIDFGVLALFLLLATWLALRKRNRSGLYW